MDYVKDSSYQEYNLKETIRPPSIIIQRLKGQFLYFINLDKLTH